MTIKAIETRYNGYRFRSRTEARWAVFFDALGVKYEYEPEGFELPEGRYLPDFRLRDPRVTAPIWIEIKGRRPSASEFAKLDALFMGETCSVYALVGSPGDLETSFRRTHYFDERLQSTSQWEKIRAHIAVAVDVMPEGKPLNAKLLKAAVVAARSARFEFGESGAK